MGGVNLCFRSPQPDTSLHCNTIASRDVPVYVSAFASTHYD